MSDPVTLLRLTLTDFRSYAALRFSPQSRLCVFTGPNGSGKTNLLEAVSLLAPGRGLRGAKVAELARQGREATGTWAVAAQLRRDNDAFEIGSGTVETAPERRQFRLDGAAPRSQADIAARFAAVWLTPQMDRLFTDSSSGRRRFLDRLVVALEPSHARELAAFDAASAQRNRLLADGGDPAWLAGLEDSMARHAVAATAARLTLASRLNTALGNGIAAPFPPVIIGLDCPIAEKLAGVPALAAEDWLRMSLREARPRDAQSHGSCYGPQKADFLITDAATGRGAAFSSTGQQKAMLIGIVLGHAGLIAALRGTAPFLLLDEPLVHLDVARRSALFAALETLNLSAWLTGTDADAFAGMRGTACYAIADGHITGP